MHTQAIIEHLTGIVGRKNIFTGARKTAHYRRGFRSGQGDAIAVVFPTTLLMQWHVVRACVKHNAIMIMQAANTGLTEGSTPNGTDYDRDVVIVNTRHLNSLILLDGGKQVIGFPGATLHSLEKRLRPLQRVPHSVIGSTCIGASIVGGIANNSGGALLQRGPAYTELSLFAQVNEKGQLLLKNHLGIKLGSTPEEILSNLDNGRFTSNDVLDTGKMASDGEYQNRLRDVDADTPARFNADRRRLYEASGCAGKVAVFAVRLDTFAVAQQERTFYIGTNDPAQLTQIRRDILTRFTHLPVLAEYIHRDAFTLAETYGKDTFVAIEKLGTDTIPRLFALKGYCTAVLNKMPFLPRDLPDRVMQFVSRWLSPHLPQRLLEMRDRFEHHLILKASDDGITEASEYLQQFFACTPAASATTATIPATTVDMAGQTGSYIECSNEEGRKAMLQRFAVASAAIRYQIVHSRTMGDILALDVALPRNERQWQEKLPSDIASQIILPVYYGHFLCHVFHQDYLLKQGADTQAVKDAILALLVKRGGKYPAEHNVGHLYTAPESLKTFYHELDPTNSFNPGIGKMSKHKGYCNC